MAIAYVGELAAGDAATAANPQTITLASGAHAGNKVFLVFGVRDQVADITGISVTDSKGNTWTIDAWEVDTTGKSLSFIAQTDQDGGVLAAGDTLTVHFGTAPSRNASWLVEEFSGLASGPADQTAKNLNNTSGTSGTTGTTPATTQANELAIAAFTIANGSQAVTKDASYSAFTTTQESDGVNSGLSKTIAGAYKILSATGTQSATFTWSLSQTYSACIATYKAAAGGTTYNDSGSGTFTLAGSASESITFTDSPSGTITLSGSATASVVFATSASGTIILSASRTESTSFSDAASGAITLTGSTLAPFSFVDSGTGTLSFTGSGSASAVFTDSSSGTISVFGSTTELWSNTLSVSSVIFFTGSGSEQYVPPGGVAALTSTHLTIGINRLTVQ